MIINIKIEIVTNQDKKNWFFRRRSLDGEKTIQKMKKEAFVGFCGQLGESFVGS